MFALMAYISPTPYPVSWRTLPHAVSLCFHNQAGQSNRAADEQTSHNKDYSNVCTTESLGKYWNMENADLRSYFSFYSTTLLL